MTTPVNKITRTFDVSVTVREFDDAGSPIFDWVTHNLDSDEWFFSVEEALEDFKTRIGAA